MTGQLADLLSFRRIAEIPFDACMAVLESWQLSGHDGDLRLGDSLLRGPIQRDHHTGTCQTGVRLARGPLRPSVRMRLDIEPWSPTAAVLELIPCQRVRPSAAYFAAGHRLLDSLTRTLPARAGAAAPRPAPSARSRQYGRTSSQPRIAGVAGPGNPRGGDGSSSENTSPVAVGVPSPGEGTPSGERLS